MALDVTSYALSKGFTSESLLGGGAVVGKNVTVSSITPIECGNRVTFSYTLDDGTVKTSSMNVMDGKDGIDGLPGKDGQQGQDGTDGIGISKIEKIGTVDLVDTYRITFTDNSTFDYEVKNGADGQGGSGGTVDAPIESISVNGVNVSPDENKNVDITVPEAYDDTALSNRIKSVEDEVPNLATKTYVGEQITNAEHLKREIVTVLPSDEDASDNIIYMLKVESTAGNDKYQEYMKIDGTVQMVGDTSVDLTDYAKTTDIPDKLPNPQKLTFTGAVTAEYNGSGAVTVTIPESSGGSGGTVRIEKLSTDTTVELEANKLYIFPEMSELTITLAEPSDTGIANEYHFVFQSGATATTLSIPDTVKLPSSFSVDASKIYEISILEGCLCVQSWAVKA